MIIFNNNPDKCNDHKCKYNIGKKCVLGKCKYAHTSQYISKTKV